MRKMLFNVALDWKITDKSCKSLNRSAKAATMAIPFGLSTYDEYHATNEKMQGLRTLLQQYKTYGN